MSPDLTSGQPYSRSNTTWDQILKARSRFAARTEVSHAQGEAEQAYFCLQRCNSAILAWLSPNRPNLRYLLYYFLAAGGVFLLWPYAAHYVSLIMDRVGTVALASQRLNDFCFTTNDKFFV